MLKRWVVARVYFLVHPPANSENIMGTSATHRANMPLNRRVRDDDADEAAGVDFFVLLIMICGGVHMI